MCGHGVSSRHHRRGPPLCRGFHRVRLEDGGRGVRMTPQVDAHGVAALSMHAAPRAILAPGAPGLLGGLPRRQSRRQQAPGPATAPHIVAAMDDCTHRVLTGAPAGLFWRQSRFQDVPLLVGQVCRLGQALS